MVTNSLTPRAPQNWASWRIWATHSTSTTTNSRLRYRPVGEPTALYATAQPVTRATTHPTLTPHPSHALAELGQLDVMSSAFSIYLNSLTAALPTQLGSFKMMVCIVAVGEGWKPRSLTSARTTYPPLVPTNSSTHQSVCPPNHQTTKPLNH
jgi:hypothetical protein